MTQSHTLSLLRHGEVPANAAGLRCGGENDQALNETGQAQIRALAERLQHEFPDLHPGCIFCGSLRRTQQSAALLLDAVGQPPIITCQSLNERLLGGRERLQLGNAELIEIKASLDKNGLFHAEKLQP